jgi:hypothetical protein
MTHIRDELALHPLGEFRLDPRGVFRLTCPLAQNGLAHERSVLPHERTAALPPDGITDHSFTDLQKIGLRLFRKR